MNMKHHVRILFLLLTLAGLSRVHAISFPEWQFARFSQAELLDPAISGETANPAGDGLSNWLKYVFDLDPHAACIEGAPAPQMLGGALALNFFHRTDYPYLIYALEASPDLTHWSLRNSFQPNSILSTGGNAAQWTVADPYLWPAGVSKFLRLKIESGLPGTWFLFPPEKLTARTVFSPYGLELRWSDRSNAEIGYRVERQRLADGVWDLFAITGQDTISCFDFTVQSGVAYAYRVRAMFPYGTFSDWAESGGVTPGGGPGGPGGGGSGGGGGGGPPDPDPDTDGDTVKDSLDQYPHDKRRSRDLPTLTYAEIDLSTAIIGAKDVTKVALNDENQVAFSYLASSATATPISVVLWKNGAQVGDTITYPVQSSTKAEDVDGRRDWEWTIGGYCLNAAGAVAGNAHHLNTTGWHAGLWPIFTMEPGTTQPNFTTAIGGKGGLFVSGWTNSGLFWGELFYPFIGHHIVAPVSASRSFDPQMVNASGQAVGAEYDDSSYNIISTYHRWNGGALQALAAKAVFALGDDGTIFGVAAGTPPDPGQPSDSLTPKFWKVSDGTPTDVSTLLPAEFRKQISFNENTTAQMNSTGDVLFNTPTLEGSEDAPVWNAKPILWTRQTSTANPNGTLALVTNPGAGLNKDRVMVGFKQRYPIDPATGEEDTTQPGYTAAVLKVPVEFVTKGKDDKPSSVSGFYNGTATPVIDATATNCAVTPAGVVTLTVSGSVTDATSDLIDLPAKQLQTVTVKWPGGSADTHLANTAAAELPWKPYQFKGTFTQAVTFTVSGPGAYPIDIETSESAAGQTGLTQQYVQVSETQTHIVLTGSLTATAADTLRYFTGEESQGDPSELLPETGAATRMFQASPTADDLKVEILAGGTLTPAADSLTVRLWTKTAPSVFSHRDVTFVETGPATNNFVLKELTASCSTFPKTHPGTFLPIMLRFAVNGAMAAEAVRIKTMDKEWKLKKKDFGDGEYLYLVDDQDKATVFNPSVNAHTHIQTKPIPDSWVADVLHVNGAAADSQAKITLQKINGLLVEGNSATKTIVMNRLKEHLNENSFDCKPVTLGGKQLLNFTAKRDGNNVPVEVTRLHPAVTFQTNADLATRQEVVWKYVSIKDTVVYFPSWKDLDTDLSYRVNVVKNAVAVQFTFAGGGQARRNPDYWDQSKEGTHVEGLDIGGKPMRCELKSNSINCFVAIRDMFVEHPELYAIGCWVGARAVALRAVSQILKEQPFNDMVGSRPFQGPATVQAFLPRDAANEHFWIPGDLGWFQNTGWQTPRDPFGLEGENVIYLGGGGLPDDSNFEATAFFWGLGFDKQTMQNMRASVLRDIGGPVKVDRQRFDYTP